MKSTEGCLRGSSQFTGVIPCEVSSNCNGLRAFHKETLHHEERPIFQTDSSVWSVCCVVWLCLRRVKNHRLGVWRHQWLLKVQDWSCAGHKKDSVKSDPINLLGKGCCHSPVSTQQPALPDWGVQQNLRCFCRTDGNRNTPLLTQQVRENPDKDAVQTLCYDVWIYNNISKEIRNPGFKSRTGKEVRADLIAELAYLQLFSRMKHYKCYG